MKIALVFSGILRSLQYTHQNIKDNILKPLQNANLDITLYCHNYVLPENVKYSNIRNKEKPITIPEENKTLLPFDYYLEDNQELVKAELDLSKYRTKGNPWKKSKAYNTLNNYILSLYSRCKITQLLKEHYQSEKEEFQYDYIIFLRSDVKFKKELDITILKEINTANKCIIPNFHHWLGGYNDRMFISKIDLGLYYGSYFNQLYDLSLEKLLHSETINKYLLEKYKADIILKPIIFVRVRTNGEIAPLDSKL